MLTLISALAIAKAQVRYEVKVLPFCTREFNEFAPAQLNNGLLFCSDRKSQVLVAYTDKNERSLTDIYFSSSENNKWAQPVPLSQGINTAFNDGPAAASYNGRKIFVTRNTSLEERSKEKSSLGIWMAASVNNDWDDLKPLPFNSNEYSAIHPAISPDGLTLYFASDMPGGFGGMDIYSCKIVHGQWQPPVNLGPSINTASNEVFPYIDRNGQLYYSTSHGSMGGLDIFRSVSTDGKWSSPSRLPQPLNSRNDDFGYTDDGSGMKGYFSSNRRGSDDIFEFVLPVPSFDDCRRSVKASYCFTFFNDNDAHPDSMPLTYLWETGDGTKLKAREAEHCYKSPGTYTVKLHVIDTVARDTIFNEAVYDLEVEKPEQVYIDAADTVAIDDLQTFDGSQTSLKAFAPSSWYWYFPGGAVDTGRVVQHSFALPGVYEVKLGVTSAAAKEVQQKACASKTIVVVESRKASKQNTDNIDQPGIPTGEKKEDTERGRKKRTGNE